MKEAAMVGSSVERPLSPEEQRREELGRLSHLALTELMQDMTVEQVMEALKQVIKGKEGNEVNLHEVIKVIMPDKEEREEMYDELDDRLTTEDAAEAEDVEELGEKAAQAERRRRRADPYGFNPDTLAKKRQVIEALRRAELVRGPVTDIAERLGKFFSQVVDFPIKDWRKTTALPASFVERCREPGFIDRLAKELKNVDGDVLKLRDGSSASGPRLRSADESRPSLAA